MRRQVTQNAKGISMHQPADPSSRPHGLAALHARRPRDKRAGQERPEGDGQGRLLEFLEPRLLLAAGITVEPPGGLVTNEAGGAAVLTVSLTEAPTADVYLPVSSTDETEGLVSVAELRFSPLDWDTPRTVTVTGVDDPMDDGDVAYAVRLGPAVSDDPCYHALTVPDVSVVNIDNDRSWFDVSPVGGLVTTEAGGTAQFTVVLTSQPFGQVTVCVSSSDPSEGSVSVSQLLFTPEDWFIPQPVTVTGVDDPFADGDTRFRAILGPVGGDDPLYLAQHPLDVVLTNLDDDLADCDFTRDGITDAADIDVLAAHFASPGDPAYDVNGDGVVDDADVAEMVRKVLGTEMGDVNLDGRVDLDDLTVLGTFCGLDGQGWAQGNLVGQGTVDLDDLTVLGTFYGTRQPLRQTFGELSPGRRYRVSVRWTGNWANCTEVTATVIDVLNDDVRRPLGTVTFNQTAWPDDFIADGHYWKIVGEDLLVEGRTLLLELTTPNAPDIVLTDVRIEPMGGWEAPIGVPEPAFGVEETHWMYAGSLYDFGAGPEPYRMGSDGPYTHYIDSTHPLASDSGNPFGTAAAPRRTIPTDVPAGSVVEIHGGSYSYGGNFAWMRGSGTSTQPVFFRGADPANRPRLHDMTLRIGGTYLVIENLEFDSVWMGLKFFSGDPAGLHHHVSLRYNEIHGLPPAFASAFSVGRGQDIVVYANHIHDNGDPSYWEENDLHGVTAEAGAQRVWVIDNHMHGHGGDSVQIVSGSAPFEEWARYVYIARNVLHEDGENAVDIKNARDIIISENTIYGYVPTDYRFSGSDGTAVVVHGSPMDVWILHNEIYGCVNGIRSNGSQRGWIIGNVIHDIRHIEDDYDPYGVWPVGGAAIIAWTQPELYVVGNTIFRADSGFNSPGGGAQSHVLVNNIIADLNEPSYHVALAVSGVAAMSLLEHNLFYQSEGSLRIRWGQITYDNIDTMQQAGVGAGCLHADPLFLDPDNNDFRLGEGSPAANAGSDYDYHLLTFHALYGMVLDLDFGGDPRVLGPAVDIGAFESPE